MILQTVAYVLIAIGALMHLFGCVGVMSYKSTLIRIHFALKSMLAGTLFVLMGVFLFYGFNASGIKALICAAFIMFTLPVAAQAMARAQKADTKG